MPRWITHEPVLWLTLVEAAILCAAAFGLPLTNEQKVAIMGLGGAVLAITGAIARQNVTPVAKLEQVPSGPAALEQVEARNEAQKA